MGPFTRDGNRPCCHLTEGPSTRVTCETLDSSLERGGKHFKKKKKCFTNSLTPALTHTKGSLVPE